MLISRDFPFKFRGIPAVLNVVRNDGHCWSRVRVAGKHVADVFTNRDLYDYPDDKAAQAFIGVSNNPSNVEEW